jgi:hypothetical protein
MCGARLAGTAIAPFRRQVAIAPGVVAIFRERVGQCDPAHWRPAVIRPLEQFMSAAVQS